MVLKKWQNYQQRLEKNNMSQHANMKGKMPSSSRSNIRGANPTYKTSVQRESRTSSSTKAGGNNSRIKDLSVDGASRTTSPTKVQSESGTNANTGGYGSGHYVPNK